MLSRRLLLVLALAIAGCGDLRVKMEVFNTAEDARRAGAPGSAWMPDRIPSGATDLRAGHLPDGHHWGVFAFPSTEADVVRSLVHEEITSGTLSCDPPGRLEFWPRLLNSPIDVERVRSTGFRLYRGGDGRTYAINWGQGRSYYWRQ
jgi:hypothetical protein